ncbi:MAG: carotenoid biosynthesis protein [Ignavibacteria bacterium]|nr:carotenoid biosynthesis protein [Ignavibacteria bacterium]
MERKKNIITKYSVRFLIIIFAVGIVGHINSGTRELMLLLTPLTLFITMGVVFYSLILESNSKLILWFFLTYFLTYLLEVVGVKTGIIFGNYNYGSTLGLKVFDVPLIIGLNWVFVILGGTSIAQKVTSDRTLSALITAMIAVAFDLILEPVAIKLDYWTWQNDTIPVRNYLAWFVISFLFAWLFNRINLNIKTDLPKIYLAVQTIFFVSLLIFI